MIGIDTLKRALGKALSFRTVLAEHTLQGVNKR